MGISLGQHPMNTTDFLLIYVCNEVALRLTKMKDQKSLRFHCHWFSRCGRECIAYSRPMNAAITLIMYNNDKITFNYLTQKIKNCLHSIDSIHFATGTSAKYFYIMWYIKSLVMFWQPCYRLHVLSPLSQHCSLIIHMNISLKFYFKLSPNCG